MIKTGKDITIVGWGAQTSVNYAAAKSLESEQQIDAEVIDLGTLVPLDIETLRNSVRKTGRLIVAHEAPKTSGFGAEIAAKIQEHEFLNLKAPILRCAGYDTPFPLVFEPFYLPGKLKLMKLANKIMSY